MKSISLIRTIIAFLAVGFAGISTVSAADGDLGSTSAANSTVTLAVTDAVKIVGLDAINFVAYGNTSTGQATANDAFCVYVNGAGTYTLTATASADDEDTDSYTMTGNNTDDTIDYTLAFNGSSSVSTTAVAIGVASAAFTGSESLTCGGSDNASVNIMITNAELLTALTDSYVQTITVTVNPV